MTSAQCADLAKLAYYLYRGRRDRFGQYDLKLGEHRAVIGPVTPALYEQHILGEVFIGAYYMLDGDKCSLWSADFDNNFYPPVQTLYNYVNSTYGLKPAISTSKRKGYHMDFFVHKGGEVPCSKARVFLKGVRRAVGLDGPTAKIDEFPANDKIVGPDGWGNYCAMPINGYYTKASDRTWYLDPATGNPLKNPMTGLTQAYRQSTVQPERLDEILLDLASNGLLDLYDKARCPDLFPNEAAQYEEEKQRRKQKEILTLEELGITANHVLDPNNMTQLFHECGGMILQDMHEDLLRRINFIDTPCLPRMFAGVSEGTRDEVALRLIVRLRNEFHVDQEYCKSLMLTWNSRNFPPMNEWDVTKKVEYVYKKDYTSLGCERPAMKAFCSGVCKFMSPEQRHREYDKLVKAFPYKVREDTPRVFGLTSAAQSAIASNSVASQAQGLETSQVQQPPAFIDRALPPVKHVLGEVEPAAPSPSMVTKLMDTDKPAPGPMPIESFLSGAVSVNTATTPLEAVQAANVTSDPIFDLPDGFTIDIHSKSLNYQHGNITVKCSKVTTSGTGVKGSIELCDGNVIMAQDILNISKQAARKKFFSDVLTKPIDVGTGDAILLQMLRIIETNTAVHSYVCLSAKNKQQFQNQTQAQPMSLTQALGGPTYNASGSATPILQPGTTCTQGDINSMRPVGHEEIRDLSPGLDYHDGIYYYYTRAYMLVETPAPVNPRGNPIQGPSTPILSERFVPVILTSNGDILVLPGKADKERSDPTVKINRLPGEYGKAILPNVDFDIYAYHPSRWSQASFYTFIKEKKQDKDWRPAKSILPLLHEIRDHYRKHVYFLNEFDHSINALWDLGTYLFPLTSAYPFCFLHGERGTGKSTVCTIKNLICFNSIYAINTSDAAIFRSIEMMRPTFILDEKEDISRGYDINHNVTSTVTLLNSSYQNNGSAVHRVHTEKGTNTSVVVRFCPYGPKVLANISGCTSTISDRSIKVCMVLAGKHGSQISELTSEDRNDPKWGMLRDDIFMWVFSGGFMDFNETLNNGEFKNNINFSDREREIWTPMYALAEMAAKEGDTSFYHDVVAASRQSNESKSLYTTNETRYPILMAMYDLLEENDPSKVERPSPGVVTLIVYDIVEAASKYYPDPEVFCTENWGKKTVNTQIGTLHILATHKASRARVTRSVKDKVTGNIKKDQVNTSKYYIREEALMRALKAYAPGYLDKVDILKR